MLALLTLISIAQASCARPIPLADLSQLVSTFERAFAERNKTRLETAYGSYTASLPCIRETLVRTDVARFHRVEGLVAFLGDDRAAALAAFKAARLAEPSYTLPPGLVDASHPLRKLYDGIPIDSPPSNTQLAEPAEGWIRLDGELTRDVPTGRPYVFQRFDPQGNVLDTAWVPTGGTPPSYQARAIEDPERGPGATGFTLRLLPAVLWLPNAGNSGVYTGLELDAAWFGHPNVGLMLGGMVGISPEPPDRVAVLPGAELGVVVRSSGRLHGWGGATLLTFFHDERAITPGGRVRLGVAGPISGSLGWSAELGGGLTTGYRSGLQGLGSAQVGLTLTP